MGCRPLCYYDLMNEDVKKILEIISDIQEHMVLRDDLTGLERSLRAGIKDNSNAINLLSEGLEGQAGFAKEIDLIMSRLKVVEHHLGIEGNITA